MVTVHRFRVERFRVQRLSVRGSGFRTKIVPNFKRNKNGLKKG